MVSTRGLRPALLLLGAMTSCIAAADSNISLPDVYVSSHSNYSTAPKLKRQKRLLYFTSDRRLTFPPGTGLFLTPTFSLPFIRNVPSGYDTGMTISLPFKQLHSFEAAENALLYTLLVRGTVNDSKFSSPVDFDVLGWVDEANPYGLFPDFGLFRKRRGLDLHSFGSTPVVYGVVTEVLDNLGYPGSVCLQRAVCEMRAGPLADSYGWLKDLLEWALTPSLNSKSRTGLEEYYKAEQLGRVHDCSHYSGCSFSIFTDASSKHRSETPNRKLRKKAQSSAVTEELSNFIDSSEQPLHQNKDNKLHQPFSKLHKLSHENITVQSLAHDTKMKKTMKKIQAIAMLQSFKKVIR
ncbi:Protein of unknown function DM4/12 [Trinorchestia longiramus]|nr:Protein of unknown function DM4/12 [Trinorchestia longiramus]